MLPPALPSWTSRKKMRVILMETISHSESGHSPLSPRPKAMLSPERSHVPLEKNTFLVSPAFPTASLSIASFLFFRYGSTSVLCVSIQLSLS